MKHNWLVCLTLVLSIHSTLAVADPASKESVTALMAKTGAGNLGMQVIEQMIPALKKMIPDAPEIFWEDVLLEIDANKMVELVVPVYQKYLTEEDIASITAFYESDAGKKLIRVQPTIMRESMAIGQQWGEEIARNVIKKYKTLRAAEP